MTDRDALREWSGDHPETQDCRAGICPSCVALATPPPAVLDVERLKRAIVALHIAGYYLDNGIEEDAEAIAAEYERLAEETEP